MKLQLWTAHYEPQRSGIAPLMGRMARSLKAQGADLSVVAAQPFYPDPSLWSRRPWPQRVWADDGFQVTRLPIYGGRRSVAQRIVQEMSHAASVSLAAPFLGRPDVIVAVSPSFFALIPAMIAARARGIPWLLWLQDILPDGATATGLVRESVATRGARRLELQAYRSAARIIVISESFVENLVSKGVDQRKLVHVYNPATELLPAAGSAVSAGDGRTVVTMGNIGHSQNLRAVVEAFEQDDDLRKLGARFVLAGDGAARPEVEAASRTDRVRVTGYLDWDALEAELIPASLALVSQKYAVDSADFNVPSKLMNFMARGLPVVAAVRENSEVARIVRGSSCGWVVDADASLSTLGQVICAALRNREERLRRGALGQEFARANFDPDVLAGKVLQTAESVVF